MRGSLRVLAGTGQSGAEGAIARDHVEPGFGELERKHGGVEPDSGLANNLTGRAPVFGGGVAFARASNQMSR